jgi:hypothetical protein
VSPSNRCNAGESALRAPRRARPIHAGTSGRDRGSATASAIAVHQQVRACGSIQPVFGLLVQTEYLIGQVPREEDAYGCASQPNRLDGEEVTGDDGGRCGCRNRAGLPVALRRTARLVARTLRTDVAEAPKAWRVVRTLFHRFIVAVGTVEMSATR